MLIKLVKVRDECPLQRRSRRHKSPGANTAPDEPGLVRSGVGGFAGESRRVRRCRQVTRARDVMYLRPDSCAAATALPAGIRHGPSLV